MNEKNNRLREVRRSRDVSQQKLAIAVGTTRQTIIAIEKGHTKRSHDELLVAIANFFDIKIEDLFFTPLVQHVAQNREKTFYNSSLNKNKPLEVNSH